jgi:hypothetical protein
MKPIVIIFLIVLAAFIFMVKKDVKTYHITCQIDGLSLYDGIGTQLEYPDSGENQLIFVDENGDEVAISNKATCQIK